MEKLRIIKSSFCRFSLYFGVVLCIYLLRGGRKANVSRYISQHSSADVIGAEGRGNESGVEAKEPSFNLSSYEVKFDKGLLSDIDFVKTHCRSKMKLAVPATNPTSKKENSSAKICLHSANYSTLVSDNLRIYGLWEQSRQKRLFKYMMKFTPNAVFVDGGAMLGVYSISAARAGFKVIAFEPFEENRRLLMTSLAINNLTNLVTVFSTGLWSGHKCLNSTEGDLKVQSSMMVRQYTCNPSQQTNAMVGATLNDLVPILRNLNRQQAVIKLDIEGSESRVLLAAREFFIAIEVPLIQMEFGMLYKMHLHNYPNSPPINQLLEFMKEMGYEACEFQKRTEMTLRSLSNRKISRWPWDIIWSKPSCVN
ncbi:uncharacterized protein LOC142338239 isoform X2 [Convolutriloba macropyga]|uniref:uncharacterized protein LOC142338239 isoform X2 n=1 Tax=Convolutriloba macropyga TaxID=536237 RepID=UPI003F524A13